MVSEAPVARLLERPAFAYQLGIADDGDLHAKNLAALHCLHQQILMMPMCRERTVQRSMATRLRPESTAPDSLGPRCWVTSASTDVEQFAGSVTRASTSPWVRK